MTPERKAELRAAEFRRWKKGWITSENALDPRDVGPSMTLVDMDAERDEMLDEIERLEALVRVAHSPLLEWHLIDTPHSWGGIVICQCGWSLRRATEQLADEAHGEHVEAILRGPE
jgi:hypothetical protein